METRIVKKRATLKKAVKDHVDIIQIDKMYEKDLRPLVFSMKLSPAQRIAAAGFLASSATGIIASLALSPQPAVFQVLLV